MILHQSINFFK